jgi:hypothetical protein
MARPGGTINRSCYCKAIQNKCTNTEKQTRTTCDLGLISRESPTRRDLDLISRESPTRLEFSYAENSAQREQGPAGLQICFTSDHHGGKAVLSRADMRACSEAC